MNHSAPVHETAIRPIALDGLVIAPENVRKTPPDAAAEVELKASIAAHGLLKNLTVYILTETRQIARMTTEVP